MRSSLIMHSLLAMRSLTPPPPWSFQLTLNAIFGFRRSATAMQSWHATRSHFTSLIGVGNRGSAQWSLVGVEDLIGVGLEALPSKAWLPAVWKDILLNITRKKPSSLQDLNINMAFKVAWVGFLRMSEFTYTKTCTVIIHNWGADIQRCGSSAQWGLAGLGLETLPSKVWLTSM